MVEPKNLLRVSPYGRISDTDEERAPGIDRQLRTVYPLIERHGGVPTREYIDNDKSAFKEDVVRDEGFEPWLEDFKAGKNDGIAAWDLDRVFRQPIDLERVIKAYCHAYFKEKRPKPALWLASITLDLTDPDGQALARILVTVANQSSGKGAKRSTEFYRDEAYKGIIYSNYPAFGRNSDGSLNEAQVAIIKDGGEELLIGVRPTGLAETWRNAGITTARGGRWTGHSVSRLYRDPGIAGIAVYKGEALKDADGHYVMRQDGAILDIETWQDISEEIKPGARKRPTKSLLGGIVRCGKCGCKMVRYPRKNGRFSYGCQSKDAGGCAGVGINGNRLDELIISFIMALLEDQRIEQEDKPFHGQARLDEISKLKRENREARNAGNLPLNEWVASLNELETEEVELRTEASKYRRKLRGPTTVTAELPDLPTEKQKAIIKTFIQAIVVAPSGRTGLFDPNRITIVPCE
ncbi:recombinase family protein [Streptomyces pseudovenezuelae]|uniref:recombinase family protein n=1 Tax=Streptomyces pseudovenezuelae TaxID=67350 RepID=UPI0036EA0285